MIVNLEDNRKHTYFMRQALRLAKEALDEDEVPVGCLIVYEDKIIAKAYNQVERLKDSTAHAEMIALTQAENFLKSKWLNECSVYVTIEPCFMCAYALVLCRVSEVFFGAYQPQTGAFGSSLDINKLKNIPKVKVKAGILEDECRLLMREFFKTKRENELDSR